MLKKILSTSLLIALMVQLFPITLTYADFGVQTFNVNANSNSNFYFNPSDTFSLDITGTNDIGEDIKSVFIDISFNNNASFSYSGNDQATAIAYTTVNNTIASGDYSNANGLSTSISTQSVTNGQELMFRRKSNNYDAFTINENISSYNNTITTSFSAKKVSDDSDVTGFVQSKNIYVNVKPHIVDKYFSKNGTKVTSIKGNNAELIDLFVAVKDYNGCSNIDQGSVIGDLTGLGLQTNQTFIYDSCEADNKTALFKKTSISTNKPLGNINLLYSDFSANDEDNNTIDPNDSHFGEAQEKDNLSISITAPGAPIIDTITLSDGIIGGSGQLSSILSYSSNQSGTSTIVLDSCDTTDPTKVLQSSQSYTGATVEDFTINSGNLVEGNNTIFACIDNGLGEEGSSNIVIQKDTITPSIFALSHKSSITDQDLNTSFQCNEDGEYQILNTFGGNTQTIASYATTLQDVEINESFPHTTFQLGVNELTFICKDNAGNITEQQSTFTKHEPTPSMATQIVTLTDTDIDYSGLNGIDINITWDTTLGENFSGFDSWRLYILPSNIAIDRENQIEIYSTISSSTGSYIGSNTLLNDSTNTPFVSGSGYKAYIYMVGLSGEIGEPGVSADAVLTADDIQKATVTKAEFIADNKLKLYTDTILDTDISSHNSLGVKYIISGQQKTANSVASISGQDITYLIENLSNTSITGGSLTIGSGSLHSSVGGFNDLLAPSISIDDKQKPTIVSFTNASTALFGSFYNSPLVVNWDVSEALSSTDSYLEFKRSSGNIDNSIHKINISSPGDLTTGSHSKSIIIDSTSNANSVELTCGTKYDLFLQLSDTQENISQVSQIQNIGFDNCKPDTPTLIEQTIIGVNNADFTWNIPLDDQGNGSGIKDYTLHTYSDDTCTTLIASTDSIISNSKTLPLTNGSYSWNIQATDNMGLQSEYSLCDSFIVDSDIPTFNNTTITDVDRSDTQYLKNGNNVSISSEVANSNVGNITANLASVSGNNTDTQVSCANPRAGITCSYIGTLLTYNFVAGFDGILTNGSKQIEITANNTSGINTQSKSTSTTLDTTPPTIIPGTLTFPNGGETIGGDSVDILWNQNQISDIIGLKNIEVSYIKSGNTPIVICDSTNTGTCTWDLSSITTGNDYKIQIKATDIVGNSVDIESISDFNIDKTQPLVPSTTLVFPNNGIISGGSTINITWNQTLITDNIGLDSTPITLEYSSNNATSYDSIGNNLINNGSYSWVVPTINSDQNIIQITAKDNVGNTAFDTTDTLFIIDSIDPELTIQYAGNGGNTPGNGKYLNNTGLNITLETSDNYLDSVYYTFENTTDNTYWNGASYTGSLTNNTLCTDSSLLSTGNNCNTITQTINPIILDNNTYRILFYSSDEAGNLTTSNPSDYIGDITPPTIAITTLDNLYISDTIDITGTSNDTLSGISSVLLQIKKGSSYWDGTDFVAGEQSLITTTSDNYQNWNYDFIVPSGDSEDQSYEIIAIANDKAYKINNTQSQNIHIKKDSLGPIIDAGLIITPISTDTYSGGDDINITWDSGKINDQLSGLSATPITLEYFNGTSYESIVTEVINSGNYAWDNIPIIDSSNVTIRLTATDIAGNTSYQNSQSFIIDSTDPNIQSIQTMEHNIANGKINALKIIFSETVNDSSISAGDFSINNGAIIPTGIATGINTNDNQILLLFQETGDTSSTPTLKYTGTSVEDLVGRKMLPTATLNSIDKATPRVIEIQGFDENSNGKLDKLTLEYSENINYTTSSSGLQINNAIAGMGINSVSRNGNTLNILLGESNNVETDTSIFSLTLSNPIYTDNSGNSVESFVSKTIIDKAFPIKIDTQTLDIDNNHKADTIIMSFSENLSGSQLSDFNFSNLSPGSSITSINENNKNITFNVQETTLTNDTSNAFVVGYTGTNIKDSANNSLANIVNHTSKDMILPYIITRETTDTNGNGKIDAITIEMSENINDDFSTLNYSVQGYTVTGYQTLTPGDALLSITLQENEVSDTQNTPEIQVLSNTSLGDIHDNILPLENSSHIATDGVGPIIIGARYDEKNTGVADDTIYITFSEPIDPNTLNLNAGGSINDFTLSSGGSLGSNSITQIISPSQVSITIGNGASPLNPGVSKLTIKTGAITDINSSPSPTSSSLNTIVISNSVVINEVMFHNTLQYIELKNLGSNPVDLAGWYIENAKTGGNSLVLNTGTIPGNGLYLISNLSSINSILQTSPDMVDSGLSLNTTSQSDLILRNTSTIFDRVQASPWPAGDSSIPKSMERRENPGNGLTNSNWYTGEFSQGFDTTTPKGTPKTSNVFDGIAPTLLSQFPLDNTLLPTAGDIKFQYSDDNVGIDGSSASITLQKFSGNSYLNDISSSSIISQTIDGTNAYYQLDNIDPGKYKAHFEISDNAGNILQKDIIFYIDRFSARFINTDIVMDPLLSGSNNFSPTEATLEIKTLGRSFSLRQSKSGPFGQGSVAIQDYDGTNGFGSDLHKNEQNIITDYSNQLHKIDNSELLQYSQNINTQGVLNTYTYKIKYGSQIGQMQEPGKYSTMIFYNIIL